MRPAIAQPVTAPRVSDSAALIVLPIRLVVGWTFFSAFWRRVALATFLSVVILGRFTQKLTRWPLHTRTDTPLVTPHPATNPTPVAQ
jgi:thiosulfate dehydrogenase (quinone)